MMFSTHNRDLWPKHARVVGIALLFCVTVGLFFWQKGVETVAGRNDKATGGNSMASNGLDSGNSHSDVASFKSPASISKIVDSSITDPADRLNLARSLGPNLNAEEISSLYRFLESTEQNAEENLHILRGIKNDVMKALRHQAVLPDGLTELLTKIYHDQKQDNVIRDYAIQHLTLWYGESATESENAKLQVRNLLNEAMLENGSVAGTALLGSHRLAGTDRAFVQDEISENAIRLAQSSDASVPTRITAIQVCAERGIKEILPMLKSLAESNESVALRISALSALGSLSTREDVPILKQFASANNEQMRQIARTALDRLEQLGSTERN